MLINWQCLILTSIYIPAQGSCWNLGYKKMTNYDRSLEDVNQWL